MGFAVKFIDLLMMCIKSVSYKVMVGDELVGPIIPTRGLRQGDPISPYLFILCAKGLFHALQ